MSPLRKIITWVRDGEATGRAERIREALDRRQAAYAAWLEAKGRQDHRAAHHAHKAFRAATADCLRVEIGCASEPRQRHVAKLQRAGASSR